MKASKFALERGAIISKITQIEKECKIEFEHIHVRTKNDNDEIGCSYEKKLTLACDNIAKQVRLKCDANVINDNVQVRGNVRLQDRNTTYDKKIS